MKKGKVGIFIILGFFLGYFAIPKALAQVDLPRVTTACEMRNGLLFAIDDGFSFWRSCPGRSRRVVLVGEQGPQGEKGEKGEKGDQGETGPPGLPGENGNHLILGWGSYRGATGHFETESNSYTATPNTITVDCLDQSCLLFVDFAVYTYNTEAPIHPYGYQHRMDVWLDGTDQSIFSITNHPTPYERKSMSVNAVLQAGPGTHDVKMYAITNGGHMILGDSQMKVLAISQ